jgi:DNA repair exonuclease SbcCD ATPase subunit
VTSKKKTVRFFARWAPSESWEIQLAADDSCSDVLSELARLTRSKQTEQLCLCIDEESSNSAPSFRRLDADEKVLRAVLMCVASTPTLYVASKLAVNLPLDVGSKLPDACAAATVPCFEHSSADDALRRFVAANCAPHGPLDAAKKAADFVLVKMLFSSPEAADSLKNVANRVVLPRNALVLHEKRLSEADSWAVRFVVEPAPPSTKAPAAPAPAPADKSKKKKSSSSHSESKSSGSGSKSKSSKSKSSGKSKDRDKERGDNGDADDNDESAEQSDKSVTKAASRRTLQKHADAIKTGAASAEDLVAAANVSISKATRRAEQADADKLAERLREQAAELERLRDAPSADEWRKLMDARVHAVEVDYGARLALAQSDADAATAALEAAQVRDRDARRLLDQKSDELAAVNGVLERERTAWQRERDDSAAQAQAQQGVAARERDMLKAQLELERDALQSQVLQLQQRAAKQAVELNDARAALAEKDALASQLELQHAAATKEARAARGELAATRESLAQLQARVAEQAAQSAASDSEATALLKEQLDEQRAAVLRLQAERRRDEDEIALLRDQVAAAAGATRAAGPSSALEREVRELREELVQSEEQCDKYAKLLQRARAEYDAEFAKLREVDALTARLEAAENDKRRLELQLRDIDSGSTASDTRHLERIDDLRAQLNARAAEVEQLGDDLAQARAARDAASELARERKQELDKLRADIYAIEEKLSVSAEEQGELTRRCLQSQNLCAEQENSLNEMRSRLAKLIATRRDVAADAGGKAPKSGQKAIDYWKGMYENELSTRSSLESLFAEKAAAVFAAENGTATAEARVAALEKTCADLRAQLAKVKSEQARLADGLVNNTSDAAAAVDQLKRERDDFRNKWHRAVARMQEMERDNESSSSGSSGSYSESEEDDDQR